jgi:hypothetical protein
MPIMGESESGVTVVVLPSECASCGKTGHNYQVDRDCFTLVCQACLPTFSCPCWCTYRDSDGYPCEYKANHDGDHLVID